VAQHNFASFKSNGPEGLDVGMLRSDQAGQNAQQDRLACAPAAHHEGDLAGRELGPGAIEQQLSTGPDRQAAEFDCGACALCGVLQ
jgi:hypothetical protein